MRCYVIYILAAIILVTNSNMGDASAIINKGKDLEKAYTADYYIANDQPDKNNNYDRELIISSGVVGSNGKSHTKREVKCGDDKNEMLGDYNSGNKQNGGNNCIHGRHNTDNEQVAEKSLFDKIFG